MRIILLGAPGSGKGTQARKLVETYKVPQISTGNILRAAAADGTEAGRRAEQIMKEGSLAPDDLVIELVSQRVLKADTRRGFILDGFPRNIPQAQELDTRLGWVSRPIQIAVNFEVEESSLVKRLTGRRICENCGAIYNIHSNPPRSRGRCDECGGHLARRDDDTEEVARARIGVYHRETEHLVQYYRAQHKLRTLNANGSPNDIFGRLCEMIDTEIRPLENKVVSVHGAEGNATQTQIVGGKIVREVTGSDVRTTRVQPRQNAEAEDARESDRAGAAAATGAGAGKSATRKPAQGKSTADNAAPKKTVAAKPASKKATAKKTTAKKAAAKKTTAKKASVKKTAAKKTATKKTPARKSTAKKKVSKRPAAKKKTAKKALTRKLAAKKTPARKAATRKKSSGKSTTRKSPAARKTAGRKTAKKAATKKTATRKKVAKKSPARKKTARKSGTGAARTRAKTAARTSRSKAATRKKTATRPSARKSARRAAPTRRK